MVSIIKEILASRDLIYQLVIRDLKVRYSRPVLGFLWAGLFPLLMVAVYYVVFSIILNVKIDEAPFFLYLMSAIFPWGFFQAAVTSSVASLVDNRHLIRESGFPHYLIPLSVVLAQGLNFLPALFIVVISSAVLGLLPVYALFLPIVFLTHLIIAIGLSVTFAVIYVRWRDIKYVLDIALLFLFYLTPAFYSLNFVKVSFPPLLFKGYIYNPFVCVLNLYRYTLIKGPASYMNYYHSAVSLFVLTFVFGTIVFWAGFYFYGKAKRSINDHISY